MTERESGADVDERSYRGRLIKMGAELVERDGEHTVEYRLRLLHPAPPPPNSVSSGINSEITSEVTSDISSEDGESIMREISPWSVVAHEIPLTDLIGAELKIQYLHEIRCVNCGSKTRKAYSDGHCYPCFMDSPYTAECVIRPALCRAHEGEGRDPEWEEKNHNQPHYVYLALSNKYKVGVTRDWPQRWIDQGAAAVQLIAITPYRQLAGEIELALSEHYSDRTSWQRMLKGEILEGADLEGEVKRARALLAPALRRYTDVSFDTLRFSYPTLERVTRVKSWKLEKEPDYCGRLIGARGQYLIFEGGRVLNLRAHSGHQVEVSVIS